MKHPVVTAAIALVLVTAAPGIARAQGFLGTTVAVGHHCCSGEAAFDGPYDVVVTGQSDRILLSPFLGCTPGYGVTVLEDSVVIDFIASVNFTAGNPFHGLIVDNLNRAGSTATVSGGTPASFSYDGQTMKMNWQGQGVAAGTVFTVTFTPGSGAALSTPCSSIPLGQCTRCDAGATPLCAGVDAGGTPVCAISHSDGGSAPPRQGGDGGSEGGNDAGGEDAAGRVDSVDATTAGVPDGSPSTGFDGSAGGDGGSSVAGGSGGCGCDVPGTGRLPFAAIAFAASLVIVTGSRRLRGRRREA